MMRVKRSLIQQSLVITFFALSGALLFSNPAAAKLSSVSPNPSDMFAIKRDGTPIPGGISHLLKNETVAQVKTLELGAYFRGQKTNHTLLIEHGIDGMKCLIKNSLQRTSRNPSYISVTIGKGSAKIVYEIPFRKTNVCNQNTSHRNRAGSDSSNRFFGRYNVPERTLIADSSTGYRHYVPITIEYSRDKGSTPRLDEGVKQGRSDENSVNFRAVIDRHGSQHALGPLQGESLEKTFGLRSAFFLPSEQAEREGKKDIGIRAEVQFGLPCVFSEGENRDRAVGLYDADTDRFGKTYLKVRRDSTDFQKGEYRKSMNKYVRWESSRYRSTATEDPPRGLGEDSIDYLRKLYKHSIIGMKELQPGPPNNRFTYYFIIDNPYQSDTTPQRANTLNIAIPFDSIYGDVNSCDYELRPDRPSTSRTYVEDQMLLVTSSVDRAPGSGEGATGRHPWQTFVARYNAMPNSTINPKDSTENPCDVAPSSRRVSCTSLFNPAAEYPTTENRTDTYDTRGDGNIICFFTRIQKPTNTSPSDMWRYSDMFCSILGKQPKVQIWGHDLRVGEDIDTSVTNIEGRTYYNWGEYAVMSDGCNKEGRATSGADGYKGSRSPQNLLHPLTFANTTTLSQDGSTQCKGNYGGDIIPSFNKYIQGGTITRGNGTNTVNINRVLNGGGGAQNPHTFSAGTKRIFYYPNATVRIRDNLNYGNRHSSISQIPRVIIVAKNIVVDNDVTRVDPWLIALENGGGGRIATCDEAVGMTSSVIESGAFPAMDTSGLLDRNRCDERVVFNSPVMASEIYLYRTHGSTGNAPARAAEVFNLRADSFLSTYAGGSGVDAVATTDAVTELPPRF